MRSGPAAVGSQRLAGVIAALSLAVAPASEAEPPTKPGWRERPHLTGDWGGWRDALADRGIAPRARYLAGFWSNLHGGADTGTRYEGVAAWDLEVDLDRLLGWTGGSFHLSGYSYHGGQPSASLVGTFPTATLSGWETSRSVRFYEILLRQTWADGRFVLEAGQLAADTDFFVSENATNLLNGTFGFLGLGRTRGLAPFYPLAAPGAYFRARSADERWEVHAGVYTGDPGRDTSGNIGFDWSFDNGAVFLGEVRARRSPFGAVGSYAIGATGTTAEIDDFDDRGTANGSWGLYALIDQSLIAEEPSRPGLGFFLRSYGAPQADRSTLLWYVDFGLRVTRPFEARERDVFGLGFAHLHFSHDYVAAQRAAGEDVSDRQSVLEVTYRLQATGWLTLQPNVQLFFDPHFGRRDATVIGLRALIEL